jgi:hypothetical protein
LLEFPVESLKMLDLDQESVETKCEIFRGKGVERRSTSWDVRHRRRFRWLSIAPSLYQPIGAWKAARTTQYIPVRLVALQMQVTKVLETDQGIRFAPRVLYVPPMRTIVDCSADIDVWPQHFAQRYSADDVDDANM